MDTKSLEVRVAPGAAPVELGLRSFQSGVPLWMRGDCPRGTSQVLRGRRRTSSGPRQGSYRWELPEPRAAKSGSWLHLVILWESRAPEQVFEVLFSFVGFSKIVGFYRKTDPRLEA